MLRIRGHRRGFALPTVLIASVVLLTILAVSVTATTASRTALKNQYYTQLAQLAGEAGVEFAKSCLQQSGGVPTWSDTNPLQPGTDCNGIRDASVDALVVAGGGSGGTSSSQHRAGGGGAGGVLRESTEIAGGSYSVTVGSGGASIAGVTRISGNNGSNSSFNGLVAIGGGGGSGGAGSAGARSGGSGGGGHYRGDTSGASGTTDQGFRGGNSVASVGGAGGGGAGEIGFSNGTGSSKQFGGGGIYIGDDFSDSVGVLGWVGGGGGSGENPSYSGQGGQGGGGAGATTNTNNGSSGTANSGGGGGGTRNGNSGAGGSGVVAIRYPTGAVTATGGTIIQYAGHTIHRFTSNGTFNVSAVSGASSCESDSRCWVLLSDQLRSSFSVPLPEVDSDGRAYIIPQDGYVELLRSSNGDVFRTYRQPAAQAATVPALCAGAARSNLGWSNAEVTTTTAPTPFPVSSAQILGISSSPTQQPGITHFRKDFNVVEAGSYVLQVRADDAADIYLNGQLVMEANAGWSVSSSEVIELEAGCNVLHAEVVNGGILIGGANLTAAITRVGGSTPLVVTDRSWRVSYGELVSYSQPTYFQSFSWDAVRNISGPHASVTTWSGTSGDNNARMISTTHNLSGGTNYPHGEYTYFRSDSVAAWTFTGQTELQLSVACDDFCTVYIDGQEVLQATWPATGTANVTLSSGPHQVAIGLGNGGTAPGGAGLMFSARRTADNVVIDRSDAGWVSADDWYSTPQSFVSYDATFRPSPDI